MTDAANAAQIAYWNAATGDTWAELQERLDHQLKTLGEQGIRTLAPQAGERILDVGCGAGQTSLQLAEAVGPTGMVTGVDISQPLLAVARTRAVDQAGIEFLEADAQTFDFEPASYDAIYSRFGVMFFADPTAAFANLRKALKPEGRLTFVCWRAPADNLFMALPMIAARTVLPETASTAPDPEAPGPFGFANPDRVRRILDGAGFRDVQITPYDEAIGAGDLEQSLSTSLRVGPLGGILRDNPDHQDQILAAVRAAMETYVTPDGMRVPAGVWIVTARP